MNLLKRTLIYALCIALSGFLQAAPKGARVKNQQRKKSAVIYKIKADATESEKQNFSRKLSEHGIKVHKKLLGDLMIEASTEKMDGLTEEELADELEATGAVEFAEPNYLIEPSYTPNDPKFPTQTHHKTIHSQRAWDRTIGSKSVLVAVADTGVTASNPDLIPVLVLPGFNTVNNTTDTSDVKGHGTAVAGTIGAAGNNGIGMTGVAWNVRIIPIRITNDPGGTAYTSDMAEATRWAADHGVKVVNMSYLGGCYAANDSAATYLRSKGGLLFMAAGNQSTDISASCPDYASIILVGATDENNVHAGFSNIGKPVDITAPGTSIGTTDGDGYNFWQGTSFASPIAAGVAALIYSLNPSFTSSQVENFILSTAVDVGTAGEDNIYGRGAIDAGAAVNAAAASLGQNVQAHPADINKDMRLDISEMGSYSTSWKSGKTPAIGPNPIPAEFVTRGGSLWRSGETYRYDTSQNCPACWQPTQ